MILVTGAAGFIGREVCRQLNLLGVPVIGLDRDGDQARQRANLEGVELVRLISEDLLEVDLRSILRQVDGVIHLAGSPGVQTSWASGFETHLANNVLSTQKLAEAMLDVPVQRMVVASSSSIYGNIFGVERKPDLGANEDQAISPMSPYGASKAAMESVVRAYVQRSLDIVPLRYFTVYGPHQRPDMAMNLMIEALRTGIPFTLRGDGTQERNYTYVGDAARATIAALLGNVVSGTPINIGGTETVSVNQVLEVVGDLAGRPVPIRDVASVPGDPQRTAADTRRAKKLLGWSPQISLRQGLAAQLDWQLDLANANKSLPGAASLTPNTSEMTSSKPQTMSPTMGA